MIACFAVIYISISTPKVEKCYSDLDLLEKPLYCQQSWGAPTTLYPGSYFCCYVLEHGYTWMKLQAFSTRCVGCLQNAGSRRCDVDIVYNVDLHWKAKVLPLIQHSGKMDAFCVHKTLNECSEVQQAFHLPSRFTIVMSCTVSSLKLVSLLKKKVAQCILGNVNIDTYRAS